MKNIFKTIWQLAEPYLDTRDNEIHTKISIEFAYKLLEAEGGDEDVVIPAIILHDVGWKEVPEELQLKTFGPKATFPQLNRIHEDEGVKIAKGILEKANYDSNKAGEILRIVGSHDSREEPISLNDKVVKDADKLFRYTKDYIDIYTKKFELTRSQMLARLEKKLVKWFLTYSGSEMARAELEKRLKQRNNPKEAYHE
ncbi:MAG: HD domain-containing protein [Deltaproteobacteria bacterium]|nr:MAG: HD domain-containing protein [Deltaproteobacteria bacterium]